MKIRTRLLCAILSVLMVMAILPATASARLRTPEIFTNGESFKPGESVVISWDEISGASKYEVCISKSPYGSDNNTDDRAGITKHFEEVRRAAKLIGTQAERPEQDKSNTQKYDL